MWKNIGRNFGELIHLKNYKPLNCPQSKIIDLKKVERLISLNNKIIPAGPLRETISSATKKSSCIFFYGKKDACIKYFNNYKKNIFFGEIFIDFKELVKIRRKKVIAFAGIAHPKNFFNLLDNKNINLIDTISFPDHYKYKENDIKKI